MSDKPYIRKIILTSIVIAIMLLLILIPQSPVYGWLNKGRYQQIYKELILDTATGLFMHSNRIYSPLTPVLRPDGLKRSPLLHEYPLLRHKTNDIIKLNH